MRRLSSGKKPVALKKLRKHLKGQEMKVMYDLNDCRLWNKGYPSMMRSRAVGKIAC